MGFIAVVAWVTMIAGVPFRLQYARERAPHGLWNNLGFREVHFRLSVAWAIIFTVDTILAAIALGVGRIAAGRDRTGCEHVSRFRVDSVLSGALPARVRHANEAEVVTASRKDRGDHQTPDVRARISQLSGDA